MKQPLQPGTENLRLLIDGVVDYSILLLSPQGIVESWNRGAEAIQGYRAGEILGQHFSVFYPPEAIAQGWPEYELKVAITEGRFEDEGWRVRKDGSLFWANVILTALHDEDGELRGFSKITRDLTERRRQEEAVRHSEERFRLLVEAVKDYAIFMLDPEGYVVSWNRGAENIKGYRAEEIIGRHFSTFYPPKEVERGWPAHELEVARAEGRFEDEGWRVRKDGSLFWANVVITALRDSENRLQGFAKVTRDMTEKRRVEALEESEARGNEFLAMLAHELRNPLAPILNALGILRLHGASDAMTQRTTDVIQRQIRHLTRLVDDLLDVSRITSNKIRLHKQPLAIDQVVQHAVESSQPLITARGQTLETRIPDEPLWVDGDLTRLAQAVMNVLNNAAKYTPEGGRIWLQAEQEGGSAVLRVRDTGIGIPAALLPKVFDLFTQGDRSLDRSEGGLGLGLTLARRLVEQHGGSIEARSEGPGHGSEFVLRFPLLQALPAQSPGSSAI